MKDRVPTKPGRVLLTPENGSAPFYAVMTRADEPTQEGDPLNKNTLLKDATAALYGLGQNGVPDDAFKALAKVQMHCWERILAGGTWVEDRIPSEQILLANNQTSSEQTTRSCSAAIEFSDAGEISLVDAATVSFSYNTYTKAEAFKGTYLNCRGDVNGASVSGIFYIPVDAVITRERTSGDMYNVYATGYLVTGKYLPAGTVEYVWSADKSAYPESGEVDGFHYTYLGVPFENAITAAQVETGTYTGDGVAIRTVPLGFKPKAVIVTKKDGGSLTSSSHALAFAMQNAPSMSGSNNVLSLTEDGFTVYQVSGSIYSNQSGTVYHYIVFV